MKLWELDQKSADILSKKGHLQYIKAMKIMLIIALIGYALMLIAGIVLPNNMLKFWVITITYMITNFGQYCYYLIMMISVINTVEYNEYIHGVRDEVGETARLSVWNVSEEPVAFSAELELRGPFDERLPFKAKGRVEGNGSEVFPLPATVRFASQ